MILRSFACLSIMGCNRTGEQMGSLCAAAKKHGCSITQLLLKSSATPCQNHEMTNRWFDRDVTHSTSLQNQCSVWLPCSSSMQSWYHRPIFLGGLCQYPGRLNHGQVYITWVLNDVHFSSNILQSLASYCFPTTPRSSQEWPYTCTSHRYSSDTEAEWNCRSVMT